MGIAHHGDVPGDGGKLGQGDILRVRALGQHQFVKAELRAVQLPVHTVVPGRQGVNLPEDAEAVAATPNSGAPAGMVGGVGRRAGGTLEVDIFGPDVLQNGLNGPLHGKEVHIFPIGAQSEHLGLVGQAVLSARQVNAAYLIQPGGLVAIVPVPGQDLQHGGQGGGAHDGGVLSQRIENLKALPGEVVLRPANLVVLGGGDKGVGDDLVIPAGPAQLAQPVFQLLGGGVAALGGLTPHEGGGNVVVAMEPGHFLGQIGHAPHVAPPGGNRDLAILHLEAQLDQDGGHFRLGNFGAQQGVDLVRLQGEYRGLGHEVQNVNDAIHHLAGPQQLHQLTGTVDSGQSVQRIQPLFKLGGRLGAHA